MRKIMLCIGLLCFGMITRGQTSYEYAYWWDNNMATGRMLTTQGDSWQTDVDVSYLSDGLHSMHIQVCDTVGVWSSPVTRYFVKQGNAASGMTYRYWFDNDNTTIVTSDTELAWLDVNALDDGLHMLHVMAEGTAATPTLSYQFLKIPQTDGVEYLHCLCYLDGEIYCQEKVSSSGGIIHWEFDVSKLSQGIHNIQIQVITPSGAATSFYDAMFIRTTTEAEMASMKCFYTIDNAESYIEAGTYANGTYHFNLDVSTLDDGLHQIAYMLVGDNGVATKMCSALFTKIPVGGNGIAKYEYWLNDNDAGKCVVEFEQHLPSYQLIALLPVESVPIRSSLFHFEVDEEKGPMVYAKNEFHIRFYDAAGRLGYATKEYIDLDVSKKITDITPLERNSRITVISPEENGMAWFELNAETGDSLTFKTDRSCSLHVYSPSGKEVYAASGHEVLTFNGCYALEDGTYYVVLHDVADKTVNNFTLEYTHIAKFALIDYTPQRSANVGDVFIELVGNGFQFLESIKLSNGINVVEVCKKNILDKAHARLWLKLEDADVGFYDLILTFVEKGSMEQVVVDNAFKMENPIYGDISYIVSTERTLQMPYPVKITVKNNGNVPYWGIPMNIAYDNPNKIEAVFFNNFQILLSDSASNAGITVSYDVDDLAELGVPGCFLPLIIPSLSAYEEFELELGFVASGHTKFKVYAWGGEPWSETPIFEIPTSYVQRRTMFKSHDDDRPVFDDGFEASKDALENVATAKSFFSSIPASVGVNLAQTYAGVATAIGGIQLGLIETGRSQERNNYEDNYHYEEYAAPYLPQYKNNVLSPADIAEHAFPSIWGPIGEWFYDLGTQGFPKPQANPIETLVPGDPNDIIGYSAESGSKYLKEGLVDVGYTIQFENDPDIATAAAHKIVVKDTLDGDLFDLSTFAATGVLLGDKRLELNGEKSFVKTIDLRTRINVIAEVSLDYDEAQGIATWTIRSLDPMTMEETLDYMQGVLPINYDGNGQGELYFNIKLRKGLSDGTEIPNRASIVFDFEEAIITPTWVNTIDNTLPSSDIISIEELNDTTVRIHWAGEDTGSDIYKYALYVQEGKDGEWSRMVSDTTGVYCDYRYYRDIDYGFCVLATDSAGNVESTEWVRKAEFMREYIAGDADRSGTVNLLDINMTLSHILGNEVSGCDMLQMDANRDGSINVLDINAMLQIILNADGEGAALRKRNNGVIRIINTKVL